MPLFLVTVKLSRNPDHNPRAKVTAPCPAADRSPCTDATGEHHTYLVEAADRAVVEQHARQRYGHVTRVEHTGHVGAAAVTVQQWSALPHEARVALAHLAPALVGALIEMTGQNPTVNPTTDTTEETAMASNGTHETRTRAARERDHARQAVRIAEHAKKLPGIAERAAKLNAERAAAKKAQ